MFNIKFKSSKLGQRLVVSLSVVVLAVASLLPLLSSPEVSAAQILTRQLSISSAVPSATGVSYTFGASTGGSDPTNGFFFGTSHIVKAMKFEMCTTAVGTCTHPAGVDLKTSTGGFTLTGWQDATAFTKDTTNQNDCDGTQTYQLCISRSGASSSENTTNSHKIVVTGVVNPNNTNCSSNPNCTFFVRMTTYTNATYTGGSITDTGTVAASTVQTLTINAAVAEILNFCVGSTLIDDATTSVGTDCTNVSGTSLNIGTLDTSTINVSPINTNGGDNKNGVAMLRTNAVNGATVSYDAIQQSGTTHQGALRIPGANCTTTPTSCITSAGASQTTFTAGTQDFGMTIAGTNCGSSSGTGYTCTFPSSNHLAATSNYVGKTGSYCNICNTADSGNGYAWVENGTVTQIASSSSVVDDEALILKFAATPSIVSTFGSYTAQADFIAVAKY